MEKFINEVEAFLERTGMSQSRFGRDVFNDPSFLPRIRRTRNSNIQTLERAREFMRSYSKRPASDGGQKANAERAAAQ